MQTTQRYYYKDASFQLELNLQRIRRELVKFLEDAHRDQEQGNRRRLDGAARSSEASTVLNQGSSASSSTISIVTDNCDCSLIRDYSMAAYYNVAPPSNTLPWPKWVESKPTNNCKSKESKPGETKLQSINELRNDKSNHREG